MYTLSAKTCCDRNEQNFSIDLIYIYIYITFVGLFFFFTSDKNDGRQFLGNAIIDDTFENLQAGFRLFLVDPRDQFGPVYVDSNEYAVPFVPVKSFADRKARRFLTEHVYHL